MSVDGKMGLVSLSVASSTILLAVMSNNMVKGSIAWRFGEKSFGRKIIMSFIISVLVGIFAIGFQSFAL